MKTQYAMNAYMFDRKVHLIGKEQHLRRGSTKHVETVIISLWIGYLTDT
jgi:hypothetical protein